MSESDPWLRWRLKEDGRGEVTIKNVIKTGIEAQVIVFNSLDQLPQNIANAIRSDGRTSGSIP